MKKPTMKLNGDEKKLLESVERGEWKSVGVANVNEHATLATRRRRSAKIVG